MAGQISALTVQKNNTKRINIFIDGEFAFGLNLTDALQLKKGQHLTDADITTLKQADARHRAYQLALNYLAYRARSEDEMRRYLQKKEFDTDTINTIIQRLTEDRYLDDADFAQQWVANRTRLKPKGKQALRHELRQKGLPETAIETATTAIDEELLAWQAVEKKLTQWQSLDEQTLRRKLTGHLARRGFNYDIINTIFQQAWEKLHP